MNLPIKVCIDLPIENPLGRAFFICEFEVLPRVEERIQIFTSTLKILEVTHHPVLIWDGGETRDLRGDWSVVIKAIVL